MEQKDKKEKDDRQICRALVRPSETEDYDFECVAVPSENGQLKYSWESDEYFYQVLRTGAENIQTARLDSGLPLFDNHPWDTSAKNTLGITVGYETTPEGLVVRCKFGARADEALRSDVKNGIIKTVSIEGTVTEYGEIKRNPKEIPVYYATKWEPESLSFAPVPQDIASQIEVRRALERQTTITEKPSFFNSLTKNIRK